MTRILFSTIVGVCLLGAVGRAQGPGSFIGPGSTVEGDILRGAGVAAAGMGQYNLQTAQAENILASTAIMVTDYMRTIRLLDAQARARHRIERHQNQVKQLTAIRERLLNDPNLVDFQNGNALNALRDDLRNFSKSELGTVLIPADVVRKLPYRVGKEAQIISLRRMMHLSSWWPPVFQDPSFDRAKVEYDRAIKAAIEEFSELRIQAKTRERVDKAIDDLRALLQKQDDGLPATKYGINHVTELRAYAILLQKPVSQRAFVDLDSYSGTTAADLLKFMDDHNIQFAETGNPEENEDYRRVYLALDEQRKVMGKATGREK